MSQFDDSIDASGLLCPLPVLKAKKALSALEKKQVLEVIATDPSSKQDFQSFCEMTSHTLIESYEAQGRYYFYIEK